MFRFLVTLSYKSILNRRVSAFLSIFSIALSVMLLLGVERLRDEARESFRSTISGADLLVGARSGSVQLLLYSVFRIGSPTNNLSWESFKDLSSHPEVAWTIPLSLGDSHRGYRVVGTNQNYFKHYRYSKSRSLEFEAGGSFKDPTEVVLGAVVARELNYSIDDKLILSHGISEAAFRKHDDKPFKVVGILKSTGTPVDRSLHVSLAGIEAIHLGWEDGAPSQNYKGWDVDLSKLKPTAITAFIVGLKSKIGIFSFQREVNNYRAEPLMALLPGVVLDELWQTVGLAESALRLVSSFVLVAGLFGMLASIYSTINERRREMAILRACGARPFHIFSLLTLESTVLAASGAISGFVFLQIVSIATAPLLESHFGLVINTSWPSQADITILLVVSLLGALIGLIPACKAYFNSLSDGLTVRV